MLRSLLEQRLLYRPTKAVAVDLQPFEQSVLSIPSGGSCLAARYKALDSSRLLLFSHGNSSSIESIDYIYSFYETLGFSYLAYDYPGYGSSPGRATEANLCLSLRSAYSYAIHQLGYAADHVVLHGISLGAAVCLGVLPEIEARCAILQGAFSSLREISRFRFRLPLYVFAPKASYASLERAARVRLPVLYVHGTADQSVPYEHGLRLKEASGGPAYMLSIEGGGHSNLFDMASAELLLKFRWFIDNLSI